MRSGYNQNGGPGLTRLTWTFQVGKQRDDREDECDDWDDDDDDDHLRR
ncbi:MAG: hypothetical protein AB1758_14050 [Candidatus Eremiobacterota bacterium]